MILFRPDLRDFAWGGDEGPHGSPGLIPADAFSPGPGEYVVEVRVGRIDSWFDPGGGAGTAWALDSVDIGLDP